MSSLLHMFAVILIVMPFALAGYAYVLYPAALFLVVRYRRSGRQAQPSRHPEQWPAISITLSVYNEAVSVAGTLEALLAVDYPEDRRQILVVSDASTDKTDAIVEGFAARGVELFRVQSRRGKTAAEDAAVDLLRGEIIINTDATTRVLPASVKRLVRALGDQSVGVASGRDISVAGKGAEASVGEAGYVGYEMWVRNLETRIGSIVGASGCFYAIRRHLHRTSLPAFLSRDFAAVLNAREQGYRSVSVDDAVCLVPRARTLGSEVERKARTMSRGIRTLWYRRALLDPRRYGAFSVMLASHKLCRWLVGLTLPGALLGLAVLALTFRPAVYALAVSVIWIGVGSIAASRSGGSAQPRWLAILGYAHGSLYAGVRAWLSVIRGERSSTWEPTRRDAEGLTR